jgi:phosphomannomutase/phosphoglucomutase
MLSLIILILMRALGRAISMDIETFMKLVVSEMKGSSNHKFQLYLKEFKLGARQIDSLNMLPTKERERDESTNSMSAGSLKMDMNIDPMYIDEHSMEVEELDDDAYEKLKHKQAQSTSTPPPPKVAEPPAAPPPPMPPAEIFKAYDIRGIVGKTLTAEHMGMIGQALGSEAAARGLKSIAFARDGRLSGPELGKALVKGILAAGIDVIDVGMVPTPVLYYAATERTGGSGVMLTGSHNPPDYNGVKMMLGGDTLFGDSIQALKQRIDNNDYTSGQGKYKNQPISTQYIERIVSDVKPARKLKVVIDSGNGVAGGLAPSLFTELGCEVIELYSEVDGHFPNHHPDPSQPENMRDLIEMVHASNADVGFAFDGDGDRIGVVSPNGSIIWPDRLMMLFAADVLKRNPGAQIIYDIKCSNNLTKVIWEKGGEPVMWKTGHSFIKAKMKQSGALLAGEMSGHIFFKERWYGFDDALYSGARLLEILAGDERSPQDVFSDLPDSINTPELRVEMTDSELKNLMDEIITQVDFPDANISMIDGIRADFENGWGLVRASNTTPSLIMRFEGKDKESMLEVQEKFRTLILNINPTISLPF